MAKGRRKTQGSGRWPKGMTQAAFGWPDPERQNRRPRGRRSRLQQWNDAVQELIDRQADARAWLDSLPPSRRFSPVAQEVEAICAFRLDRLLVDVNPSREPADAPQDAAGAPEPLLPFFKRACSG